jgi:hypothetical protein
MATYSTSIYHLQFSTNYRKVQVRDTDGQTVAEFALDTGDQSLGIRVIGSTWHIDWEADFGDGLLLIDVGAGSTLSFDGTRLGGLGIVDIRDMKVSPAPQYQIEADLACCQFRLKYVSGPLALRLDHGNLDCITQTPI